MKKSLILISTFVTASAVALTSQYACAQQFVKKYNDWSVYTTENGDSKLCYMISYPKKKNGNYRYRGEPYAMVTSIGGKREEFSITSGYKYKSTAEPRAIIDGQEYRLSITEGEMAWFKTSKYDHIAITKMKKGNWLKVKGTSTKGTYSVDTYSLKGFTNAYSKVKKLCSNSRGNV